MYKKKVTVLVPSELMYAFDPNQEILFVATRVKNLIVLHPVQTQSNNHSSINSKDYQKGYLMGMSDGYHKGYSDALAYEDLQFSDLDDDDDLPDCTDFCQTCPHYDDLFDSCKQYI
jgi:hypothetical protein